MKYLFLTFLLVGCGFSFAQNTLFIEEFESPSSLDQWKIIDNDHFMPAPAVSEYNNAWIQQEDPITNSNGTVSSTSYFIPSNRADRWLISPAIQLGAEGNFISWKGLSYDPSYPDSYKVMISTTGNDLEDFTDTLAVISNETPYWTKHTYSLEDYEGEGIYLAFVNTTFDGFKLYLDSIYVRDQDPLAVKEEIEVQFTLFPNPTKSLLTISAINNEITQINIYNTMGELLHTVDNPSKIEQIDLSSYAEGIYFFKLYTLKGVFQRKVLKQ